MKNTLSKALAPVLAVLLCAGCSPEPCTNCLQVAGTYTQQERGNTYNCGARSLILLSGPGPVVVAQAGKVLSLDSSGTCGQMCPANIAPASGVLYQDFSASFGPLSCDATDASSSGTAPVSGKCYLDGWFVDNGGSASSFHGSYSFIADDDHCEVSSEATWSKP